MKKSRNIGKYFEVPTISCNKKGVVIKQFESMSEAARFYNIPLTSIASCIYNKNLYKDKLYFFSGLEANVDFINNFYKKLKKEILNKKREELKRKNRIRLTSEPRKAFYQISPDLTEIKKWNSLTEASKQLNYSKTTISRFIHQEVIKVKKGYFWVREELYDSFFLNV